MCTCERYLVTDFLTHDELWHEYGLSTYEVERLNRIVMNPALAHAVTCSLDARHVARGMRDLLDYQAESAPHAEA